jgi:hypothetical protein
MVAKYRERSIVRRLYSASLESTPSHSYEQLTELLADVEVDIFRPGLSMPRGRTPWSRCGGRSCWVPVTAAVVHDEGESQVRVLD